MNLLLFKHGKQEVELVAKMGGSVGLAAALQAECSCDFFFDAEEMVDIGGDGLAVIFVVKFAAMHPRHVLQPTVVMLLMKISRKVFAQFTFNIYEPIVEHSVSEIARCFVAKEAVDLE
jgi:hypothetical protein